MLNIAVLVSGGGTNLQALLDAEARGEIKGGRVSLVVSSKDGAYAIERASKHGVESAVLPICDFPNRSKYCKELVELLHKKDIGLVVLAGFMVILSKEFIDEFKGRIINVHPALIPAFCGEGFYGLKVHEKALEYGVKLTGATVHFVNEITDGGEIILQKAVEVKEGDTPEALQKRVMEEAEWELLPRAVSLFCEGRLRIEGRRVIIK